MDVCRCGFAILPKQMMTESYFSLSQQIEATKKKILTTVFLDGREIFKKVECEMLILIFCSNEM